MLVVGRDGSGAFLGERLPQVLRRKADLATQIEELLLGEFFDGVAARALKLSRAREHALERRAIEPGNRNVGGGWIGHVQKLLMRRFDGRHTE
jgi:hypothetical protein